MKSLLVLFVVLLCQVGLDAQTQAKRGIPYGKNPAAGKTFTHDGIQFYYEVYGTGEPLLLIHGNGSSIGELKAQNGGV